MTNQYPDPKQGPPVSEHGGNGRHGLLMIACCVPIVAVVVLLVATGVAGAGVILVALGCIAMMPAMVFMMAGGRGDQ
jgi:F0F1-type ATP synthase assembly protein I